MADLSIEQLHAQAHVWNHTYNIINTMSLKCALELGIPDMIHKHKRPMKLSELVHHLPINPQKSQCLHRLMRLLVHSEFFVTVKISEDQEEGYWLTPASRLLLRDEPVTMREYIIGMTDPIMIEPLTHMSKWFRDDGLTPFASTHGRAFWEYAEQEPRVNDLFNEAMVSDSTLMTKALVGSCKQVFDGVTSIVDVGGGKGTICKVISGSFPSMKCIVLDLPRVVEGMEWSDKLVYVAGDMFRFIPSADAILLKWILHNWSDEECVKILKKCKEAILRDQDHAKGKVKGKLIIIETVVSDQKGDHMRTETQLFFDVTMMKLFKGRERTEKEFEKMFLDAGFSGYKINHVLGLRSVIEVFP